MPQIDTDPSAPPLVQGMPAVPDIALLYNEMQNSINQIDTPGMINNRDMAQLCVNLLNDVCGKMGLPTLFPITIPNLPSLPGTPAGMPSLPQVPLVRRGLQLPSFPRLG